jgi:hypothetical protein
VVDMGDEESPGRPHRRGRMEEHLRVTSTRARQQDRRTARGLMLADRRKDQVGQGVQEASSLNWP